MARTSTESMPKKKKGEEPTEQIAFRVPVSVARELDRLAAESGMEFSPFMRFWLRKMLPVMRRQAKELGRPIEENGDDE